MSEKRKRWWVASLVFVGTTLAAGLVSDVGSQLRSKAAAWLFAPPLMISVDKLTPRPDGSWDAALTLRAPSTPPVIPGDAVKSIEVEICHRGLQRRFSVQMPTPAPANGFEFATRADNVLQILKAPIKRGASGVFNLTFRIVGPSCDVRHDIGGILLYSLDPQLSIDEKDRATGPCAQDAQCPNPY